MITGGKSWGELQSLMAQKIGVNEIEKNENKIYLVEHIIILLPSEITWWKYTAICKCQWDIHGHSYSIEVYLWFPQNHSQLCPSYRQIGWIHTDCFSHGSGDTIGHRKICVLIPQRKRHWQDWRNYHTKQVSPGNLT